MPPQSESPSVQARQASPPPLQPPRAQPADPQASVAPSPTARAAVAARSASAQGAPTRAHAAPDSPSFATSILGWGGAAAFVLAAAYLIRLGVDSGWLTPLVQIAAAVAGGLLLIIAGFRLRGSHPRYAGYLPACGIVILFLAIYGGHLFYALISVKTAALLVIGVCGLSLWLCRVFESDLYALFAVAGSYSAPFLLSGVEASITDLVIYYSAWSVVFSIYAVWCGRRLIYLLALYLALIGFDAIWQIHASKEWIAALAFQTAQFVIFGIATVVFSVRRQQPLDETVAMLHLPPLLLFYALQYVVLAQHVPALAPWISFASVAAVGLLYLIARRLTQEPLPGGELLLWCYLSVALLHAGYLEAWPSDWAPWASFILVPVAFWLTLRRAGRVGPLWALWAAVGAIFLLNYVRVVVGFKLDAVPGHQILAIANAAMLYLGYAMVSRREGGRETRMLLVYAGHVSAMAAAVHLLDAPIIVSTAWGLLALACLGISMWRSDRMLGQSSLLVFGATAGKVLLYDLSGAQPLARIISLVVLGATFYIGGMFYQRLAGAR
nr:DUF2339 domain-containing protein [Rhodanobacter sp. DHG33]